MSGESIRCPQCGGSPDVGRSAVSAKCVYCGSTIKLKVDAAGQVIPFLEQMQQDSSIVAKRAAIEVMEASLAKLVEYRADLERDMEKKCAAPDSNQPLWALLGVGLGAALGYCIGWAVDISPAFPVAVMGGVVGLMLSLIVGTPGHIKKVKASFAPRIAEADATIRKHEERIRELRADVARLALTV